MKTEDGPEITVSYGEDCARYSADGVCYVEMFGQLISLKASPGFLSPREALGVSMCLARATSDAGQAVYEVRQVRAGAVVTITPRIMR